jgi:hypothetical protein
LQAGDLFSLFSHPLHEFVDGSMRHIFIAHGFFLSSWQQRGAFGQVFLLRTGSV